MYSIEDLVESVEGGRAVAFIGSGVSAGAGLPDWPALLRELIASGFQKGILDEAERDELTAWAGKTDYLMLADAIRRQLGRADFQEFMTRKLAVAATPTELHRALASLPFAAFVTTNFDRLFEHAWSGIHGSAIETLTHQDRQALRNPFGRGTPFLLKTHGCASKPDTLVLGLEEFREAIHGNRSCQTLLQSIFLRYQVLFIGHSLTDPDLLFLLDQLVGTFGIPPGRHFALIKDEDVGRLRAATFRHNYGIEVLRYTATPGHPEVLEFVRQLQSQVSERHESLRKDLQRQLREQLEQAGASPEPPRLVVPTPAVPQAAPARHDGAPDLREYCAKHLGGSWPRLADWYDSLGGTPGTELLRINLDRECQREDLDPAVWQELLRRLAAAQPSAADPYTALRQVVEEDPGLFMLRGRRIDGPLTLRRYLRARDFEALLVAPSPTTAWGDVNLGLGLENKLLGRPGRPVWCSDATYAAENDPHVISTDLWVNPEEHIVEIAYTSDALMPDNFVRVATVPDIYWYEPTFANVKKPAEGASGWGHTVRLDDPSLRDRAPSAVHAPLRLLAARTKNISLRVVRSATPV